MNKRIISILLTVLLVFGSGLSAFATGNPEGTVPDLEDINGFYPGVRTQYFNVQNMTSIGDTAGWTALNLDSATKLGDPIITNGLHTTVVGTAYATHKASLNSFFYAIQYNKDLTKDALRHEGYLYLKAGTTPMQIISDDGVILRMDLENPNAGGGISYTTKVNEWYPHGALTSSFVATVEEDGYYRYQLDFFNWGGDGVLRWLTAPTQSFEATPEVAAMQYTDIPASWFYLYKAPAYTLTIKIEGSGTVAASPEPTEGKYLTGTNVGLTPTAAGGWTFAGFSDNVSENSILMDGDKTVVATFTENPPPEKPTPTPTPTPAPVLVPLTVAVEGPGTAWPTGTSSYSLNSVVVMNVTADEGAVFEGWFGQDGSDVNGTNGIEMNAAKSVIARFKAIEEPVVVQEEPVPETAPDPEVEAVVEPVENTSAGDVEEEIILEEAVAQDAPELPKTSGLPLLMLLGLGGASVLTGLKMKRK